MRKLRLQSGVWLDFHHDTITATIDGISLKAFKSELYTEYVPGGPGDFGEYNLVNLDDTIYILLTSAEAHKLLREIGIPIEEFTA